MTIFSFSLDFGEKNMVTLRTLMCPRPRGLSIRPWAGSKMNILLTDKCMTAGTGIVFCVNVYITICLICLCLCGYLIKEFFLCVWLCRPSPKSYQNLGFQVYDMYFF